MFFKGKLSTVYVESLSRAGVAQSGNALAILECFIRRFLALPGTGSAGSRLTGQHRCFG